MGSAAFARGNGARFRMLDLISGGAGGRTGGGGGGGVELAKRKNFMRSM